MMLIDTHAHLYLPEFAENRNELKERAKNVGVEMVLLPAIDSSTHDEMIKMEENDKLWVKSMIGLHPCSVKEDYIKELDIVEEWLGKREFVAVGEIGLDFYWDLTYKDQQYGAFRKQIELALKYKLPIAIHSRNATDESIEVIKEYADRELKGVFHCFSGTAEQARSVIDTGFLLGIGGVLTFKNSGLDKAIAEIDLKHMVLETDSPYLAPVPFRGKRNESSYLSYVVDKLAELKGRTRDEVAAITTSNAQILFGV